jgi:hypothetical protein
MSLDFDLWDSRAEISLKNILRLQFEPEGIRKFMDYMSVDLGLGPWQTRFNSIVGNLGDLTKLFTYGSTGYLLIHEFMNNYLN